MRLLLSFSCAICCAAIAVAAPPAPTAPLAELIVTRQSKFIIPFEMATAKDTADEPVEVLLYVTADQGTNWRLEGRLAPPKPDAESKRKASFAFSAPYDGEYWFVIRTVDRQNRLHPDNNNKPPPELRVMVDTIPPRLELSAARGPNGEIRVHFQAVDPNLLPESLKIEFQSGAGPWRTVAIDSPQVESDRGVRLGDAIFWPDDASSVITVRGEIADRAGNPAASQVSVQPERAGTPGSLQRQHSDLTAGLPPRPTEPRPTEPRPTEPHSADPRPTTTEKTNPTSPSDNRVARRPETPIGSPDLYPAVSGQANPPVSSQYVAQPENFRPLVPPGEKPWMVNRLKFDLEYETESVGPSGIGKVEIWGTRDGGRSWTSFATDPDKQSPIQVSVPGEGIYGFRITVQNQNGQGGAAPKPGSLPEIWVNVDTTQPRAALGGIEAGAGEHAGQLAIRWEASDANLAPRPITLSFSDRPGGPWSPIIAGGENTGVYYWRPDGHVPQRIYLRLEVRDQAGNVSVVEPAEPFSRDDAHPKAHLRSVRANEANSQP